MKDTDRARWLADMIPALSDYAHEASVVLVRQADEIDRLRSQIDEIKALLSEVVHPGIQRVETGLHNRIIKAMLEVE